MIQPKQNISPGSVLELTVDDPRGFNVDSERFPLGEAVVTKEAPVREYWSIETSDEVIVVRGQTNSYVINRQTGLFQTKEFTGPELMILPLNKAGDIQMHGPSKIYAPYTETCSSWTLKSIDISQDTELPVITVKGSYAIASGQFVYRFNADGTVEVDYDFGLTSVELESKPEQAPKKADTTTINPRQLGIVFNLPKRCEVLSWKRKGYWTTYPEWHIARLEGTARASEGFEVTPVGPRDPPEHEWRHDRNAVGSHDFASTKHNITTASLLDKDGRGLEIRAQADRHVRGLGARCGEADLLRAGHHLDDEPRHLDLERMRQAEDGAVLQTVQSPRQ
ncbi:MAG: hypothetical protein HC888_03575 [Candidatus Competibacteraceae bacterium]|nr:hypothetical protein [Candidatus Competibacteraceae bacterium]